MERRRSNRTATRRSSATNDWALKLKSGVNIKELTARSKVAMSKPMAKAANSTPARKRRLHVHLDKTLPLLMKKIRDPSKDSNRYIHWAEACVVVDEELHGRAGAEPKVLQREVFEYLRRYKRCGTVVNGAVLECSRLKISPQSGDTAAQSDDAMSDDVESEDENPFMLRYCSQCYFLEHKTR